MKPAPSNWPRLSISLYYDDPVKAIEWLERAFGFETRLRVEGDEGHIIHSELTYGEAVIMVSHAGANPNHPSFAVGASPHSLDGRITQSVMLYVDDVDAHCERARAAGAKVIEEPAVHDYGEDYWADRSYGALDIEGHMWWITQRLR